MIKDYSGIARQHSPITKQDLHGSPSGECKSYFLEPEELAKYRSIRPPEKKRNMETLGYQSKARGMR
jgi:hypothetical protein